MHYPIDRIAHITVLVTSHGALAGMRNSSMGPPRVIDLTTHCTMNGCSLNFKVHLLGRKKGVSVPRNILYSVAALFTPPPPPIHPKQAQAITQYP